VRNQVGHRFFTFFKRTAAERMLRLSSDLWQQRFELAGLHPGVRIGTTGTGFRDHDRQALASRRFRAAVDADWQRCRDLGITAVPTFVVGNRGVVGAESYEVLEALVVNRGAARR
jgi:hypothetical protein